MAGPRPRPAGGRGGCAAAGGARIQPDRACGHSGRGSRVEIIEFFYYGCPVCYETEPLLSRWLVSAPEYVSVRRVPALITEAGEPFARLYYTLEALGEIERLHWPVYDNFHFDGD